LFKNDAKKAKDDPAYQSGVDEKKPDYKGSALIHGVEYWVSAWVNTAKDSGKKYFSMKYQAKQEAQQRDFPSAPINVPPSDEKDLPF